MGVLYGFFRFLSHKHKINRIPQTVSGLAWLGWPGHLGPRPSSPVGVFALCFTGRGFGPGLSANPSPGTPANPRARGKFQQRAIRTTSPPTRGAESSGTDTTWVSGSDAYFLTQGSGAAGTVTLVVSNLWFPAELRHLYDYRQQLVISQTLTLSRGTVNVNSGNTAVHFGFNALADTGNGLTLTGGRIRYRPHPTTRD